MKKNVVLFVVTFAAMGLLLVSCGDDDTESPDDEASTTGATDAPSDDDADEAGGFPVTITTDDGDVTVESRPERIVSLSPASTEMLFAIGAGDQVIAADEFSDYPEDAPTTELSGYQPNVEAVAEYEPDLIVVSAPIEGLDVIGAPVIVQSAPVDVEGSYTQIEQLGAATGNVGGSAEVVGQMQTNIAAAVDGVAESTTALTYFHEVGTEYYTSTSDTFVGSVYALFDLENVADAADPDGAFGGYPQMTDEAIIDANPDVVFLADTVGYEQTAETVAARPGWEGVTAVVNGNIVELDDSVASRWGPRIVELVELVAAELAEMETAGAES